MWGRVVVVYAFNLSPWWARQPGLQRQFQNSPGTQNKLEKQNKIKKDLEMGGQFPPWILTMVLGWVLTTRGSLPAPH